MREFLKFGSIMLIKNLICLSSCLLVIMVVLQYKMKKNEKWKIEINDIRIKNCDDTGNEHEPHHAVMTARIATHMG